jgi:hypothetical protein
MPAIKMDVFSQLPNISLHSRFVSNTWILDGTSCGKFNQAGELISPRAACLARALRGDNSNYNQFGE